MRNTVGSGDSRTLRIDDIIPYKTNLNGLNNYYNSSDYTLNFSNSFNDNSNLGIFLGSDSVEPSFNNGVLNGYVVNDGTCVNMGSECNRTSSVNASFGNAISFDGVDQYANIGTGLNNYVQPSNDFTISFWVYSKDTNINKVIFGNQATPVANRTQIRNNFAGNLDGYVGGQYYNTGVLLGQSEWKHITLVNYDDVGTMKFRFYIDGVQVGTDQNTGSGTNNQELWIGGFTVGDYFNGSIDSVMIFDEALNQTQIQEQMSKTNPIVQSVANYNFDESQGTKVLDGSIFVQGNTTNDVWNRAMAFNGSQYSMIVTGKHFEQ